MKNEPAYPTQEVRDINGSGIMEGCYGLTKRELFAAMAMQGLCSNAAIGEAFRRMGTDLDEQRKIIIDIAVGNADALIKELSK